MFVCSITAACDKYGTTKYAKVVVLHPRTGQYRNLILSNHQPVLINNILVSIAFCRYDKKSKILPTHMVMMRISQQEKLIFNNFVFARYPSINLPNIDGYFFYLDRCYHQSA